MGSVGGLPKQTVQTKKATNVDGVNSQNKNTANQSLISLGGMGEVARGVICGGLNEAHPPAGDLVASVLDQNFKEGISKTIGVLVTAMGRDGDAVGAALTTALETGDMGAAAKTLATHFAYNAADNIIQDLTGGMTLDNIAGLAEQTGLTDVALNVFKYFQQPQPA